MTLFILCASLAGILIALSRQLNGRLSLPTSPLIASLWNNVLGFGFLTIIGLSIGGLIPTGALDAPWYAYLGSTVGVVFVASGSWLVDYADRRHEHRSDDHRRTDDRWGGDKPDEICELGLLAGKPPGCPNHKRHGHLSTPDQGLTNGSASMVK
jgi:hypothetical protein